MEKYEENQQVEKSDAQKAFERYLEENKGKPIDIESEGVKKARNELELKKRGYKPEEPDELTLKERIVASLPKGRLLENEYDDESNEQNGSENVMPEEDIAEKKQEIQDEIFELEHVIKIIFDFLKENPDIDLQQFTLLDLMEKVKDISDAIEVKVAIEYLFEKNFTGDVKLSELHNAIENHIEQDASIWRTLEDSGK